MNYSEIVNTRRSVRQFSAKPIAEDNLNEIIREAQMSPSWKNTQTVSYYAVHSAKMKASVLNALPEFNRSSAQNADVIVVMVTKHGISGYNRDGSPTTVAENGWEYFDAGIACQTLCLSAWARGIATCIMGIYDEQAMRVALDIPEEYVITAVVPMGYPAQEPVAPTRKSIEEKVKYV